MCPSITLIDGKASTTSIEISKVFGKDHADILKRIRLLQLEIPEHAGFFSEMVVETKIGGGTVRKDPAYGLTRDGFTLLAMGFTGKKALQFKLAYIEAFNRMEAKLLASKVSYAGKRERNQKMAQESVEILLASIQSIRSTLSQVELVAQLLKSSIHEKASLEIA